MGSKPRIIIWFVSNEGRFIGDALNILERQFNGIEIVGITANEKFSIEDIPFIPFNEISVNGGCDIILVAGAKGIGMSEVTKFANAIKIDTEKLLGDWIVCIPGFTLQKYRQLQRSRLSIFSINCFGGLISNTLGLQFRSPLINMFIKEDEYIKFLRYPRLYMSEKPVYDRDCWENNLHCNYPVGVIGNISLYFNHYKTFEDAVKKWEDRKSRINWYNIFVEIYTENPKILEQFDELPYGKKICFVPFKSDLDSAFYINRDLINKIFNEKVKFWDTTNRYAEGRIFYCDMFDMLLYGKKTPLINM